MARVCVADLKDSLHCFCDNFDSIYKPGHEVEH